MEKLLKIPYTAFNDDWDLLQRFLVSNGNPKYELVGNVDLSYRKDIIELKNLVSVGGYLDLRETPIKLFGKVEYVSGDIYLSKIHQIPKKELTKFRIDHR